MPTIATYFTPFPVRHSTVRLFRIFNAEQLIANQHK